MLCSVLKSDLLIWVIWAMFPYVWVEFFKQGYPVRYHISWSSCWSLMSLQLLKSHVPTYDSTHPWWLYSVAPLENQAAQHWPNIPFCHIILTLSLPVPASKFYRSNAECQAGKWQVSILYIVGLTGSGTDLPHARSPLCWCGHSAQSISCLL